MSNRMPNVGPCSVDWCDKPARKRGMCASHYAQRRRYGEIRPPAYSWAAEKRCVVCGATDWPGAGRKFCSAAHKQLWHRNKGAVPSDPKCVRCGRLIDLATSGNGRRRKRSDTMACAECRGSVHDWSWPTAIEIARRDGTDCGICGQPVDMAAKRPDPMRRSVDHVVPRANGGSDDPANFQLAHLRCNQMKGNRTSTA